MCLFFCNCKSLSSTNLVVAATTEILYMVFWQQMVTRWSPLEVPGRN